MFTKNNILWVLVSILFLGCAPSAPLDRVVRELERFPEFSIILEDMKEEGNFFKNYFHRYKIVYAEKPQGSDELEYHRASTDWLEISKDNYEKYYNYLGMVLVSKSKDGKITDEQYPPGYQYVGDPRYGTWRQDTSGNSFWEFYGKYALFSHLFGMFGRPIYRTDWDTYRNYRTRGAPYYGGNNQYGTNGSYTKRTNRSFFERQRQKELARQTRFNQKIKQRTRRSKMSGFRSRSRGFGK